MEVDNKITFYNLLICFRLAIIDIHKARKELRKAQEDLRHAVIKAEIILKEGKK